MGLDTVELVMEIEDEFKIQMPDADAQLIQTVGQLHAYVCHRLRPRPVPSCPSARAFYHLRSTLLRHCPIPRSAVRPSALVCRLLPEDLRACCWPAIANQTGLRAFYSFDHRSALRFPAVYTTLRDLVRRMSFPRPWSLPALDGDFERRTWETVRRIVSQQVGVRVDEIHSHTHFIHDLNTD
ncbi:MAG TPA: acyl carrier protein [Tepidisphaeraceae bacterium]|jgi:acyl carrier protein